MCARASTLNRMVRLACSDVEVSVAPGEARAGPYGYLHYISNGSGWDDRNPHLLRMPSARREDGVNGLTNLAMPMRPSVEKR